MIPEDNFIGGMDSNGRCKCYYTGKKEDCDYNPAAYHYHEANNSAYYISDFPTPEELIDQED